MAKVKKAYLLLPVLLSSLSSICWSESFTAKVKLTLINPLTLLEQTPLDFGAVSIVDGGHCTLEPASGKLSGNACPTSYVEKSVIHISGTRGLGVMVNLTAANLTAKNGAPDLQFIPQLFNGVDNNPSFVLNEDTQSINVGGKLLVSAGAAPGARTIDYNFEVLYQ